MNFLSNNQAKESLYGTVDTRMTRLDSVHNEQIGRLNYATSQLRQHAQVAALFSGHLWFCRHQFHCHITLITLIFLLCLPLVVGMSDVHRPTDEFSQCEVESHEDVHSHRRMNS